MKPQDTHGHQHVREYYKDGIMKNTCITLLGTRKGGTFTNVDVHKCNSRLFRQCQNLAGGCNDYRWH